MSCSRQCYDVADLWQGHDDCSTCSGKDDGASTEVKVWRRKNWVPHADNVEPTAVQLKSAPDRDVLNIASDHADTLAKLYPKG